VLGLLLALGGTVEAAKKINGRSIVVKSIPGDRLKPKSVAANRLKPGVLGKQITGPLTGAAIDCAARGGTLPEALQLAAFAGQEGVSLDGGDEWSGGQTNVSGLDVYGVVTVSSDSNSISFCRPAPTNTAA
jgi:hypothetical protein